jgi:hypothetical protein
MKPGASKSKGNRFENLIGRHLSLWLTNGEDKYQLISTRMSGGWEGAQWRHAGDLAPNGEAGERFRKVVMVECKHRREDLLWALYNPPSDKNIQGWWEKLTTEAHELNLVPMIVFRQNQRGIMVVVTEVFAYALTMGISPVIACRDMGIIPLSKLTQWTPAEFYELLNAHEHVESEI